MANDGKWDRRSVLRAAAVTAGAAAAVGVSYPELLDQLISSALHNQR